MALMRSEWNGSETSSTWVMWRALRKAAAEASDCHDEWPDTSRRMSLSRTPLVWRELAEAVASVKRSPGWRPPVTTTTGEYPSWYRAAAWSSWAVSTGDGRP